MSQDLFREQIEDIYNFFIYKTSERISQYLSYYIEKNNLDYNSCVIGREAVSDCFRNPGKGTKALIKLFPEDSILKENLPWAYFLKINNYSEESIDFLISEGTRFIHNIESSNDGIDWSLCKRVLKNSEIH
jgi:hypothetical protein